jgi:flagellar motor component MotA
MSISMAVTLSLLPMSMAALVTTLAAIWAAACLVAPLWRALRRVRSARATASFEGSGAQHWS